MGDGERGKIVECNRYSPKTGRSRHRTHRTVCFFKRYPYCQQCKHSEFVLTIPIKIGEQLVQCPRWEGRTDRDHLDLPPSEYVEVRRALCLRSTKVFQFCTYCPNSDPLQPPKVKKGWLKRKKRKGISHDAG